MVYFCFVWGISKKILFTLGLKFYQLENQIIIIGRETERYEEMKGFSEVRGQIIYINCIFCFVLGVSENNIIYSMTKKFAPWLNLG